MAYANKWQKDKYMSGLKAGYAEGIQKDQKHYKSSSMYGDMANKQAKQHDAAKTKC